MKRCPVEQGGCGALVEMLFDSGLCQKCDAAVAKGTAAVGGPPAKRRAGRRKLVARNGIISEEPSRDTTAPCDRYVKGLERGICATCGATRAEHRSKPKAERKPRAGRNGAAKNGTGDKDLLENLRDGYAHALAEAEQTVAYLRVKVEAANEILSELQRAR